MNDIRVLYTADLLRDTINCIERTVTLLLAMAEDRSTSDDPYGGLFHADDADTLSTILPLLRALENHPDVVPVPLCEDPLGYRVCVDVKFGNTTFQAGASLRSIFSWMRNKIDRYEPGITLDEVAMDGTRYWCKRNACDVVIIATHVDDGACLIAEKIEDDDISGKLVMTEASNLVPIAMKSVSILEELRAKVEALPSVTRATVLALFK